MAKSVKKHKANLSILLSFNKAVKGVMRITGLTEREAFKVVIKGMLKGLDDL